MLIERKTVCACAAEFDSDGTVDKSTIRPLVDGGTEGLRGHARVIYPGVSPCFDCTLWLFPPQVKFPLCTLAETPRSPAHCIEYAHLILWGRMHDEEFDSDNEDHMMWVCRPRCLSPPLVTTYAGTPTSCRRLSALLCTTVLLCIHSLINVLIVRRFHL